MMIVEIDNASQLPHVAESPMPTFNGSVHSRFAMAPDELAFTGLEKYAPADTSLVAASA